MAAKVASRRTKETVLQRYWKNAGSYKYAKRIRQRRERFAKCSREGDKSVVDEDVGGKRWGVVQHGSTAAFGARSRLARGSPLARH